MILLSGVITDPAGVPVPGAIIELRAIKSTAQVLMGSVLTYKCDPAGQYHFSLAVGAYDAYAQNDRCGDMDYLGTAAVGEHSEDGDLYAILVDGGLSITPPVLDNIMAASEAAIAANELAQQAAVDAALSRDAAACSHAGADEAAMRAELAAEQAEQDAQTVHTLAQQVAQDCAATGEDLQAVSEMTQAVIEAHTDVTNKAQQVATDTGRVAADRRAVSVMHDDVTSMALQASSAAQISTQQATASAASATEAEAARDSIVQDAEEVRCHAEQVAQDRDAVAADCQRVAQHATEVASQHADVLSKAQQVSSDTATVVASEDAVTVMHYEVVGLTTEAVAAADTASQKAVLAAQSEAVATDAAARAENAAGVMVGTILDGGVCDLSSGRYPPPIMVADQPYGTLWYVQVGGTVSGEVFEVGDLLRYTTVDGGQYVRLDARDAVFSVNGLKGAVELTPQNMGAELAGTADQLMAHHSEDPNPHRQYEYKGAADKAVAAHKRQVDAHEIEGVKGLQAALSSKAARSHTHTAGQALADIIAGNIDAIGLTGQMVYLMGNGIKSAGFVASGASLCWCSADAYAAGGAPLGSWRLLGTVSGDGTYSAKNVAPWIRIA